MQPQIAPRTFERYAEIVRTQITPALGSVLLPKLQPLTISQHYAKCLASGRRDGKGGLSPQSVRHIARVLSQALGQAVRWRLIPRNPCDVVDPPKVERRHLDTFDMGQTVALLDAMRGTRMFIPTVLAVLCGLRRGEIGALRWGAIDLADARLSVLESAEHTRLGVRYKEPKSGRTRSVALSGTVVEELRQHRVRQAEEQLRIGLRQSDDGFVCAQVEGSPLHPMTLTQEWRRLIRKSGLPPARLHDMRHTHATHLLAHGVHPKIAAERLGHSRVGTVLDIYSHVSPTMQTDAAATVDAALQAAINERS